MNRPPSVTEVYVDPNRPRTSISRQQIKRRLSATPNLQMFRDSDEIAPGRNIPHRKSFTPSLSSESEQLKTVVDGRESERLYFRFDEKSAKNVTSGAAREGTPVSVSYGTIEDDKPLLETSPLLAGFQNRDSADSSEQEDEETQPKFLSKENMKKNLLRQVKVLLLSAMAVICMIFIIIYPEADEAVHQISVSKGSEAFVNLTGSYQHSSSQNRRVLSLTVKGPLIKLSNSSNSDINMRLENSMSSNNSGGGNLSETLPEAVHGNNLIYFKVDQKSLLEDNGNSYQFKIDLANLTSSRYERINLTFHSRSNSSIPVDITYHFTTDDWRKELCAAIILLLVYGLIIFELVHRTLAGILGSLAAIAVMSAFGMRPSLEKVVTWLDVETLSLLFGMMVIVSIFSETGFFDYCALMAYKLAKGKVWPLITLLCLFSTVVSAFLDNVTTMLLLSPITIRLCEVLNLDPRKILIAEVLFSNIGGTATAIGDPPNVILVSNNDIKDAGIHFSRFTVHMLIGILFATVAGYGLLRFIYRNIQDLENKDPIEITELKHEIEMWRREANSKVAITREEKVMKTLFLQKATVLENSLIRQMYQIKKTKQKNFKEVLIDLKKRYKITDYPLLLKSGLVLVTVIMMFFLHPFVSGMHIDLGWIALMGAIWLMVLADIQELETILQRVEWSTLIFFAGLFSMMEALKELGLIDWISAHVKDTVMAVDSNNRMLVAILLILWVSAVVSSFIDNIPFTTAMIPVLLVLGEEPKTGLPLLPLVLALAFGACLGGNGTIIGASANVLCAGIAEQHGYGFTFWEFFKIGFPMMIVTNAVAMVYLIICHVWGQWNY